MVRHAGGRGQPGGDSPGPTARSRGSIGTGGRGGWPRERRPRVFSAPKGMTGTLRCGVPAGPQVLAHLCSSSHLLCGFEEFWMRFPTDTQFWQGGRGVIAFFLKFFSAFLVLFIRTATGATPPSPSGPFRVPAADPKTCLSQNSGSDRTQGAKRVWGQGTETRGDPEERQQQGESLRQRAGTGRAPGQWDSAVIQPRDRNKPLFFLSS